MSENISNEIEYAIDAKGDKHEVVDYRNDPRGATLGFWAFLFNELTLFGVLFAVVGYYMYGYTADFIDGSKEMELSWGTLNTFILLISTLTMALSVVKIKEGKVGASKSNLIITIILSIVFVVIKGYEWSVKIGDNIYPLSHHLMNDLPHGQAIYFDLYFILTGLHAIHVIIGILVMLYVYARLSSGTINQNRHAYISNLALYWDFVHIVWIFLFPLFYLIGAGA